MGGVGRTRTALLTIAGAYTVHHGRYLIAYCNHAREELGGGPHGYLSLVAPLFGCIVAMTLVAVLARLTTGRRAAGASRRAFWIRTSLTLAASYAFAEFFEGRFDAEHRAGLSGALGHGGFGALLIAILVAAALALLYKASAYVIRRIAKAFRGRRREHPASAPAPARQRTFCQLPAFVYLSLNAGRAPPAAVASS